MKKPSGLLGEKAKVSVRVAPHVAKKALPVAKQFAFVFEAKRCFLVSGELFMSHLYKATVQRDDPSRICNTKIEDN